MKRVCQLACAAALFCPAIFGEAAEVQVTEFTKLAPRHKVDGVLNALSLVRMKAAFLNVDKDSPRGPLYSEVAENGALTIIDCRMKLETKEICAQHGFYEEKRHPANAEGFQGGRMRSDPKASVAVAAYKKGEKIFENEQLVKALGQPLTDEASTIFALAVETGVLDPTSSKKPDEYNKENLALIGKLSDEFWDHIGRAIKAKYSKHVSHRGAESEDSFDAWGEEPQGTDHAGFVINPAAEAVPYPSIAPIGFFPGFPNWPDLMDWQSVSQIPELGAELLSNVTRNVASHFLGRTGDNTRQTSAPVPIPGFLGSIPPQLCIIRNQFPPGCRHGSCDSRYELLLPGLPIGRQLSLSFPLQP